MRLPRLSVRAMLALVLLSCLTAGGCVIWRRSSEYRHLADIYRSMEAGADEAIATYTKRLAAYEEGGRLGSKSIPTTNSMIVADDPDSWREYIERSKKYREIYRRTRLKYDRAARHPWLSVPPDSPRPN